MALRAELCFEIRLIFTISLREIVKMRRISKYNSAAAGGKRLFMALRAKYSLDEHIFFLTLRSKIRKKMCSSKEYSAAFGGNLFVNVH